MEGKAMANKIVYRTEDEVRDSAKIQLGFDKAEADVNKEQDKLQLSIS